ncbi:MAG: hypothetical protein ABJL35_13585 [Parasphingorhabdus sp.]|uniref:hypothetical protein n=1 Tax=Parasphingorhabdus sp. TaxID=2709688 RepID=UPI0032989F3E
MLSLFESDARRTKDATEVRYLFQKHGDRTIALLEKRSCDHSMTERDRRHWKRILKKARLQKRKIWA